MKNNLKKYRRNCPSCGTEIEYVSEKNLQSAIKKNTKCKKCVMEQRRISNIGAIRSDETKLKQSVSHNGRVYKKRSVDQRIKMSMAFKGIPKSEEHKQKLSKINMGKIVSDDTKQRISESRTGFKHSSTSIKNMRLSAISRIEERIGQMMPNYNPASIPIIEQKAKELGITDLQHAENGGEFYIKELGYWVDGYSKEQNTVIEYYEKHHNTQIDKDLIRQEEIQRFLGCKFIIIT
jgi:hypothetical protein